MSENSDQTKKQLEDVKKEAEERMRKQNQVKQELLETEKTYKASMEHFNKNFLAKLKGDKKLMGNKKIQVFVRNAEKLTSLIALSNQLAEELEKENGLNNTQLSETFIKFLPVMAQLISDYTANHDALQKSWKEIKKERGIVALLAGRNLDTLIDTPLTAPIQRIARYPLLFKELLKHVSTDDESYTKVNEAFQALNLATGKTNLYKATQDENVLKFEFLKALKAKFHSPENKRARSVEFSKQGMDNFFDVSKINNNELKTNLTKNMGNKTLTVTENKKNKSYNVTVTISNFQGTNKPKEFKFEILKGKAGVQSVEQGESKFFHVRVNQNISHLNEDERKEIYGIMEQIGGSVIQSMKENPNNFNVQNPNNSSKPQSLNLEKTKTESISSQKTDTTKKQSPKNNNVQGVWFELARLAQLEHTRRRQIQTKTPNKSPPSENPKKSFP